MSTPIDQTNDSPSMNNSLCMLSPSLVKQVDDALAKIGGFGEVRLVVVKGKLRFIQIMQSESVQEQWVEG